MRLHLEIKITTPPNTKQKENRILNRLVDNISSLAVLLQLTLVCFLSEHALKKKKKNHMFVSMCMCMEGSKLGRHRRSYIRTVWKLKHTLEDNGEEDGKRKQKRLLKLVLRNFDVSQVDTCLVDFIASNWQYFLSVLKWCCSKLEHIWINGSQGFVSAASASTTKLKRSNQNKEYKICVCLSKFKYTTGFFLC